MGATLESVYTTSLLISSSNELFQNFTVHEIQAYAEAAGLALVIFPPSFPPVAQKFLPFIESPLIPPAHHTFTVGDLTLSRCSQDLLYILLHGV